MDIKLKPIGTVRSCFKEKFGIPRQAGLAKTAAGYIELDQAVVPQEAAKGLESFTHLWIIFHFHGHINNWSPTVRPPRLGGNRRVGVFASRAPYRPNPIGLSVVKLDKIEKYARTIRIHISGIDLLDGTPVIDIKPYMPISDSLPRASNGWIKTVKKSIVRKVVFSKATAAIIKKDRNIKKLISEIILLDPRPRTNSNQTLKKCSFAVRLGEYDIKWTINEDTALITEIISQC